MKAAIIEAAQEWASEHSWFVEAVNSLEDAVVFSSTQREIVRRALGLPPAREPGDIDLLVPREGFARAARHLGAAVVEREIAFPTADGQTARFRTREAITRIAADEVQFMEPLTAVAVGRSRYHTAFTRQGVVAATGIETSAGVLRFAHPVDTIGLYGILQRNMPKDDLHGAAALLAHGSPLTDAYALQRMAEVGWDDRVQGFVMQAGLIAAQYGFTVPQRLLVGVGAAA